MPVPLKQYILITQLLVTFIAFLTLSKHLKHHLVSNQVKILAILSQFTTLILILIAGYMHYFPVIDALSCNKLIAVQALLYILCRFLRNSFYLSRLRHFFNSSNLALNIKVYYGCLLSYFIFVSIAAVYFCMNARGILIISPTNSEAKYCHPSINDDQTQNLSVAFGIYVIICEGFMQCISLYLYYLKYKQLILSSVLENIDINNHYVKRHMVKRSLICGIFGIMSTWTFGIFLVLGMSQTIQWSFMIEFVIQSACIVFSFDFCSGMNRIHQESVPEDVNMMEKLEITTQNREYLEKIMKAYYKNPTSNKNNIQMR